MQFYINGVWTIHYSKVVPHCWCIHSASFGRFQISPLSPVEWQQPRFYCFPKSLKILRTQLKHLAFNIHHRKKSQSIKLGEQGGHQISPFKETTCCQWFQVNDVMCVTMHYLAETKGFLLFNNMSTLANVSSVTSHNDDHCLLLLSHSLLKET